MWHLHVPHFSKTSFPSVRSGTCFVVCLAGCMKLRTCSGFKPSTKVVLVTTVCSCSKGVAWLTFSQRGSGFSTGSNTLPLCRLFTISENWTLCQTCGKDLHTKRTSRSIILNVPVLCQRTTVHMLHIGQTQLAALVQHSTHGDMVHRRHDTYGLYYAASLAPKPVCLQ